MTEERGTFFLVLDWWKSGFEEDFVLLNATTDTVIIITVQNACLRPLAKKENEY